MWVDLNFVMQYGANEQGKLLNLMQTVCPFCRRTPTVKILRRYNPGVAALGGLRDALADNGWYYAWCTTCGFAKRAFERQCREGDGLPNVDQFACSDCSQKPEGVRYTPCPQCGVVVEKVRFFSRRVCALLIRITIHSADIWVQSYFVPLRSTLLSCLRKGRNRKHDLCPSIGGAWRLFRRDRSRLRVRR